MCDENLNSMINRGFFQGAEDAAGFAPSFIEKPRIIPNETGTLITMKCKCRAKPKPEVTWYRGTTVVKESSKIKIKSKDAEEDVYELILEIKVRPFYIIFLSFFYFVFYSIYKNKKNQFFCKIYLFKYLQNYLYCVKNCIE